MNKQEAIEKIKDLYNFVMEDGPFEVDLINKNQVLDIVSQIDEPQKPVVPKFVADFYESIKDNFEYNVYELCLQFDRDICESSGEVWEWFDCGKNEPIQTLVKMKLYGYEVEQEKLYTVEIPDPYGAYKIRFLFRNRVGNILIGGSDNMDMLLNKKTHLTESEIKQDFEWAWDAGFAKPVKEN